MLYGKLYNDIRINLTSFYGVHGRLSCALCLHQSSRIYSSSEAGVCLCCEDSDVKLTWPFLARSENVDLRIFKAKSV